MLNHHLRRGASYVERYADKTRLLIGLGDLTFRPLDPQLRNAGLLVFLASYRSVNTAVSLRSVGTMCSTCSRCLICAEMVAITKRLSIRNLKSG